MTLIARTTTRQGLLITALVTASALSGCDDGTTWSYEHAALDDRGFDTASDEAILPYSTTTLEFERCPNGVWHDDFLLASAHDVQQITGYREIDGNLVVTARALTDLSSLECVEQVESLVIRDTEVLTSLEALSNLSRVRGDLIIVGNSSLTDINGLDSLVSVDGSVRIAGNDGLIDLDGLGSLETIERGLHIKSNSSLTNLHGLGGVRSVWGGVAIAQNGNLSTLGLSGLQTVERDVLVESNRRLPQCEVDDLREQLLEWNFRGELES